MKITTFILTMEPQPILSADEIQQICNAKRPTTQAERLRQMGFTVLIRADNTPLVSRANFLIVTGGIPTKKPANQDIKPDWGAF